MRLSLLAFVSVLMLLSISAFSQNESLNPNDFTHLSAPASPTSVLLGLTPSAVLKPKSMDALETALATNVKGSNGIGIPDDFSLEFSPYWLSNHGLGIEEYLDLSFRDQLIQNSSISLGSTNDFLLRDSSLTNAVAFGYRVSFKLRDPKKRQRVSDYLRISRGESDFTSEVKIRLDIEEAEGVDISSEEKFDEWAKTILSQLLVEKKGGELAVAEEIVTQVLADVKGYLPGEEASRPYINEINTKLTERVSSGASEQIEAYFESPGRSSFDLAYATFVNFPSDDFEKSYFPSQNVWATFRVGFGAMNKETNLLVVFRQQWYDTNYYSKYFGSENIFSSSQDLALAFEHRNNKFNIQFEAAKRFSSKEVPAGMTDSGEQLYVKRSSEDLQYSGSVSYELGPGLVLTYVLGQQFDPLNQLESNIISTLSANFGFGRPELTR